MNPLLCLAAIVSIGNSPKGIRTEYMDRIANMSDIRMQIAIPEISGTAAASTFDFSLPLRTTSDGITDMRLYPEYIQALCAASGTAENVGCSRYINM